MNPYIGHEKQLYGVNEVRLVGGKGDGMRLLQVKNAAGLNFTVSVDRCADISELSLKGDNFGYFAPCGYVAPAYYDDCGAGFLKSFTAGFMTTCGLRSAGNPCEDAGEALPLHGTISHIPCESIGYWVKDEAIHIKAVVRDAAPFAHALILEREYICPIHENVIYMTDTIKNIGFEETPVQVLYHCNMGYPLLSEKAKVTIPASGVKPRNDHAQTGLDTCLEMEKPQKGYEEMCFYHELSDKPTVSIYNEEIGKGLEMTYDTKELKFFTEWKMMAEGAYVLGLEPGNCIPDGRDVMRKMGELETLKPGEEKKIHMTFTCVCK